MNPCNECNAIDTVVVDDDIVRCTSCTRSRPLAEWDTLNPIPGITLPCVCGAGKGWRNWSHNKNDDTYGLTCGWCSRGTINQSSWQQAYDSWQEWMARPAKKKVGKR